MVDKKVFRPYNRDEITDLIRELARTGWEKQYEDVKSYIDRKILDAFSTVSKIAPVLTTKIIAIRCLSIQLIFDTLSKSINNFKDELRRAGEEVGLSFAHELINTFKDQGKGPGPKGGYEGVLETWAGIDSSAGWADKIELNLCEFKNRRLEILFIGNFLTRGYASDHHRHCSFLEGYLKGVINQLFAEWSRLIEREYGFRPKPIPTCRSVKENPRGDNDCMFLVELGEETLSQSQDRLIRAYENYDKGNYNDSCNDARIVLEHVLKEKVGVDVKIYRPFNQMYKIYVNEKLDLLSYKEAKDIYFRTSRVVHGESISKDEAFELIRAASRWIRDAEELELSDDKCKLIKELILKIPEKSSQKLKYPIDDVYTKIEAIESTLNEIKLGVQDIKIGQQKILSESETLKKIFSEYAKENTEYLANTVMFGIESLKKILIGIETELTNKNPTISQEASKWRSFLEKVVDLSGSVVDLFAFLTGIPSVPELIGSPWVAETINFLKNIANLLKSGQH